MSRLSLSLVLLACPAAADEGMWTFDNPPRSQLQERYGFGASAAWLDQLRLSSVRFMDGGSGSFVSAEGLMITNHHVGRGCIQNVSSREHDYMANGFLAASRDQELACPGYEVNVLVSFEDVSARVKGATKPSASDQAARETRKAEMTRLEDECVRKTGLRCDVVALYQGGEYWLYRYKKYTDVRLVFAPEGQIAFFGGDSDNFTYPRHDLDICLMRAYEAAKPAKPAAFLRVAPEGTKEGDLVFISGHPGSTSRLLTLAQLEAARDWELPDRLAFVARRLGVLREFGARSPESLRRAQSEVFGLANAEKGLTGRKDALEDAPELQKLAAAEKALREKVAADPAVRAATGDAWEVVAAATARSVARLSELRYAGFQGSRTLAIAAHLVRLPVEVKKPSASRLEEYVDASLPSLKNKLFSAAPIHADLEEATLADQLSLSLAKLGPDHAFVKAALGGKTPTEAARAALAGTRLFEVSARKALFDGGTAAVLASSDPMIALARRIDPVNRQIRTWYETEVDAPQARAAEKIAAARFAVYGKTLPPDATFTLRLSYGSVKSLPMEGSMAPAYTTFYGLYDRSAAFGGRAPWHLPARWRDQRSALSLETPYNFVSTNDIIGGNSGSPVVDREGRFVGIVFDGNIASLAWDYYFTEARGRSVSVDVRGILEALRKLYGATALLGELGV
jgi:hypothetical protein